MSTQLFVEPQVTGVTTNSTLVCDWQVAVATGEIDEFCFSGLEGPGFNSTWPDSKMRRKQTPKSN